MTMTCNWLRIARYALAAGAVCMLTGCSLAGVAASRTTGNMVNAKYVPNKTDTMLIMVESYGLSLDSGIETEHMTLVLRKNFEDAEDRIAGGSAGAGAAEGCRSAAIHADDNRRHRPQGGRPAGAVREHLAVGNRQTRRQRADARTHGRRGENRRFSLGRYPLAHDAPSEAVQITTDWTPESADKTENDLRAQMADEMAADIGKLFQNYHPDGPDGKSERRLEFKPGALRRSPSINSCHTSLNAASMPGSAHSAAWAGWWNRDVASSTARAAATGSTCGTCLPSRRSG